ncbi:MAG: FAD-dependent oxidoreductase [Deltaproteobacteria bacterium]|nr:MAG: FAD-dependent oxidoreductase [Deltaproteobacteria bacterium]
MGDQLDPSTPHPDLAGLNGKRLAVVGSGPAGMSAAYFARLLGFSVTIYEKLPVMGGILRVGIPSYRLPRKVIEAEFEGLSNMGIDLRPNTEIGKNFSLNALRNEYDYVFLGTGVHASIKLGIPQEDQSHRVISGLTLLNKTAFGETVDLGKRVTVIGGGNTAIDSARTALRLGCEVTIIYRRSQCEMPAHFEEVQEAREEGVQFRFLAAPQKIVLDTDQTIKKLVCCRMELGPADESGRRRPIKKEGAFFDIKTYSIICAFVEKPDLVFFKAALKTKNDCIVVKDNLSTPPQKGLQPQVFAGGDIIDIAHTVVHAVASGKKAAIAMDCHRNGANFDEVLEKIVIGDGPAISFSAYHGWKSVNPVTQNHRWVLGSENIVFDYFKKASRVQPVIQDTDTRKQSFNPYRNTFDPEAAGREALRCMHCGRCTECDNCLIFCPDMSVLVKGRNRFGYAIDYDYCKGCGICFTECPRHAITMIDEDIPLKEA